MQMAASFSFWILQEKTGMQADQERMGNGAVLPTRHIHSTSDPKYVLEITESGKKQDQEERKKKISRKSCHRRNQGRKRKAEVVAEPKVTRWAATKNRVSPASPSSALGRLLALDHWPCQRRLHVARSSLHLHISFPSPHTSAIHPGNPVPMPHRRTPRS